MASTSAAGWSRQIPPVSRSLVASTLLITSPPAGVSRPASSRPRSVSDPTRSLASGKCARSADRGGEPLGVVRAVELSHAQRHPLRFGEAGLCQEPAEQCGQRLLSLTDQLRAERSGHRCLQKGFIGVTNGHTPLVQPTISGLHSHAAAETCSESNRRDCRAARAHALMTRARWRRRACADPSLRSGESASLPRRVGGHPLLRHANKRSLTLVSFSPSFSCRCARVQPRHDHRHPNKIGGSGL